MNSLASSQNSSSNQSKIVETSSPLINLNSNEIDDIENTESTNVNDTKGSTNPSSNIVLGVVTYNIDEDMISISERSSDHLISSNSSTNTNNSPHNKDKDSIKNRNVHFHNEDIIRDLVKDLNRTNNTEEYDLLNMVVTDKNQSLINDSSSLPMIIMESPTFYDNKLNSKSGHPTNGNGKLLFKSGQNNVKFSNSVILDVDTLNVKNTTFDGEIQKYTVIYDETGSELPINNTEEIIQEEITPISTFTDQLGTPITLNYLEKKTDYTPKPPKSPHRKRSSNLVKEGVGIADLDYKSSGQSIETDTRWV